MLTQGALVAPSIIRPTQSRVAARARLSEFMRHSYSLGGRATRLHRADRLSDVLDREVWFKRDDLTAFALGGNKIRKLELIAATAARANATHLVTVGAVQSNHVRAVAAAASRLDMSCDAVLSGTRPERLSGNTRLASLFGARLHFTGSTDWRELEHAALALAEDLSSSGAHPFLIPVGGAMPEGSLAFAAAYLELNDQCLSAGLRAASIVHASSSGGTQAGLELGRWLADADVTILGVDVAAIDDDLEGRVVTLARASASLLGVQDLNLTPTVVHGYLGRGYAAPSDGAQAAQRLVARCEGVLLDHVYSAKAMHALIEQPDQSPVVFWNTGGSPAFFAEDAPDVAG